MVMGVVLWTLATPVDRRAPRMSKFHALKVGKGGVAEVRKRQSAVTVKRRSAGVGRVGRTHLIGRR